VNLMVGVGERFHVDTVDLYAAAAGRFAEAAAKRAALIASTLKRNWAGCCSPPRTPRRPHRGQARRGAPAMTSSRARGALELLCSPDLLERVADAFGALGVVGERQGAPGGLAHAHEPPLGPPLGAVIQSSSSAGKSTLADAALALVPKEAKVAYSAMTGQALYYLGESDLAHKVLSIAEEEGRRPGLYPLKLLVSRRAGCRSPRPARTRDRKLVTNTYEVTGPSPCS
jgi:DNA primase